MTSQSRFSQGSDTAAWRLVAFAAGLALLTLLILHLALLLLLLTQLFLLLALLFLRTLRKHRRTCDDAERHQRGHQGVGFHGVSRMW